MLTRPRYRVYFNDPDGHLDEAGVEVEITHADQLRGELEASKQGLPPMRDAPMNHTTIWLWCALRRLGAYSADYRQFKLVDMAGLEPVKDEAGEPVTTTVDPTQPGAGTGPVSSSPRTLATPASGYHPTPTSD